MDIEKDDKLYNDRELMNEINKLIIGSFSNNNEFKIKFSRKDKFIFNKSK